MSADTDTLESMCELIVDCPHFTPKWTDAGFVVLRNQNIKNGVLNLSTPSFTNGEDYQRRIKRAAPKAGDIVFTREAPMGEVCIIPEELKCCLGQRQVLLRPKDDVCSEYLFWALQSSFVQHQIAWNEGTGSTVSNVRIPVLKALNIPRHPDKEVEIAKILSDLAGKIELNRQTNQTLEHIAQAIFKSWFVDFEPTRAKIAAKKIAQARQDSERSAALNAALFADGRWPEAVAAAIAEGDPERAAMAAISGKSLDEIDQLSPEQQTQLLTTAALFPDALVDSELGEIPQGWSEGVLGDVIEQRNERVKASVETEDLPYVPIDCISPNSLFLNEYKNGEDAKSSLTRIYKGDFIFGAMRPYFHKVCIAPFDATTRSTAFVLKPKNVSDFSFTVLRLHETDTIDFATLHSTGSTIPYAKWDGSLSQMGIVIPLVEIREKFDQLIRPLLDSIPPKVYETESLKSLRNVLLPKLLSGELDVNTEKVA